MLHEGRAGKWDRLTKKVQLFLNTSVSSSTGETPLRLLCGFNPTVPDRYLAAVAHPSTSTRESPEALREAALSRLKSSFEDAKKYYDRRHFAAESLKAESPGDIVWFAAPPRPADGTSRKLDPLFRGPMVVSRVLDHDTYAVASLDDNNRYVTSAHIDQLRLFGHGAGQTPDGANHSTRPEPTTDPASPSHPRPPFSPERSEQPKSHRQAEHIVDESSGDGVGLLTNVDSIPGTSSQRPSPDADAPCQTVSEFMDEPANESQPSPTPQKKKSTDLPDETEVRRSKRRRKPKRWDDFLIM